jgi:urea transport system substrate-binding protein
MSFDRKDSELQSQLRRQLLKGLAALPALSLLPRAAFAQAPATAAVNTTGLAVTDSTVKVGILHSVTGTMAISETGSVQAEKLAIEQINEAGGVLGRKIEFVQEDGASDWPTFAEKAKKLLVEDKAAAVFGCWTSASRKAVLPVFEQYNGMLYYPTFYEGLEQSKNVIYTGQEATQQIIAGLDWVTKEKGAKTFYLLGSDYIWPRTSNKIARKHIENKLKLEVVGEEYFPLGHTQFNSVINKIKLRKPDVIYAIIVGGSNVAFYKQLKAAGFDLENKQTLLTISVTEDEIRGIGGENVVGAYACMKYFQSLENDNNKAFVSAFKKKWGAEMVIGDVTQAAYLGPWLWKLTVEKAGSFDIDKVAAASPDVEFKQAPEGYVRIHQNHHLWSKTRVGRAQTDGQFKLIYETADLVEPNPFPAGYQ